MVFKFWVPHSGFHAALMPLTSGTTSRASSSTARNLATNGFGRFWSALILENQPFPIKSCQATILVLFWNICLSSFVNNCPVIQRFVLYDLVSNPRKDRYNKKIRKYYVVYEEDDEELSEEGETEERRDIEAQLHKRNPCHHLPF